MEIDMELSKNILERYNKGEIGKDIKTELFDLPQVDNKNILDFTKDLNIIFTEKQVIEFFETFNIPNTLLNECKDSNFILNSKLLSDIGVHLYPYFSFGVLNGGSATSYVDSKKNRAFSSEFYLEYKELFTKLAKKYTGKPKGITPAFINPNRTSGPSFMELKMRNLLIEAKRYSSITGKECSNLFPIFQMSSTSNNEQLTNYYESIKNSPYLKELLKDTGIDITNVKSGIQPLITAYTHSSNGKKKELFYDKNNNLLPIPGGHGQCFMVLKDIFKNLYSTGIRFISIGNVDNIGYTVNPKALALLAISGKQATFDFAFKTEYDIKGGVLIRDPSGKINCGDIGVVVPNKEIVKTEKNGDSILFNSATGLFNLKYLIENIDTIIEKLPMRFSDQNKDAGLYSQGEQITWEILGLLSDFYILAIDKYDRFLASKLLLDNLLTSGLTSDKLPSSLKSYGKSLNEGLKTKLSKDFELKLNNGQWENK